MTTAQLLLTKGATPSNPAANLCALYYSSSLTPVGPALIDESGNVLRLGGFTTKDYRLVKVTHIFQGTVSYTPTSGVTALFVECWGAGGQGGGAANAATNSASGGGGGAGAYSAVWSTANVSGAHTVAVGAKGSGAGAGATGNDGGDTTFADTAAATICAAKGGKGGIFDTVSPAHVGVLGGAGGASASGTGDVKCGGGAGGSGIAHAAASVLSGAGAPGFFGGGAIAVRNATAGGNNAETYGAGGSGAAIISGGASQAGGTGADGLIRVWEYA